MLPYFTQEYSYGILSHELKRGLDQQHPCPIPAGSVWASIVQGKWILVTILQYGAREDLHIKTESVHLETWIQDSRGTLT